MAQIVDRAKILIYKAQGESNHAIAERIDVNINTVKLCIKKYKQGGIQNALYDEQRKGRKPEITDDAKSWIVSIACKKLSDTHKSSDFIEFLKLQDLFLYLPLHMHHG